MSYWQEKVSIGARSFPRFIGGPLDGIIDSPFRRLIRTFSPNALLYSEMRYVGAVAHERGARNALRFDQVERPLNFQVSANKEDFIQDACKRIQSAGVDVIDLNLGCPDKNVIKSGCGSCLMSDTKRLRRILTLFRREVTSIPFTVKIRAGFKHKNAVEVAKIIEDAGADALAIHPRLRTEFFEGRPDYLLAAQVKKAVSIPVLLSGNVINWPTARQAYEITGADGFLIGRGLWSRPWKIQEMEKHAAGDTYQIAEEHVLACALKHLDLMIEYYGDHGLFAFRKHVPFYIKGRLEASRIRQKLVRSCSIEEVKQGLIDFFEKIDG